jgi:anti-sigma factor RsiW
MNNHLPPQKMLAYIDGELSKSETRQVEEHLHSCWTCLTEVERLKDDIALILDAQKEQFEPALPPPPKPWVSFETLLARNLPQQQESSWTRMNIFIRSLVSPARILVSSVVVAGLMILAHSFFRARTVSAKEVLQRVQMADTRRATIRKDQVIRERVHVRKTAHGQIQPQSASVDTWKSPTAIYWNVNDDDSAAADLKEQYQAHGIAMSLPLSAASIDSWGKAAGGTPTVSQQGSDMDVSFAGTGSGAHGTVERVSLLVQPATWQIKQMTLEFFDESFEVTEDDYSVMPTSDVPADMLAHLEPAALPPVLAPTVVPPLSGAAASAIHLPMVNLDKAELNVFATLHSLKADLGEPVSVTRSGQAVQVGVWQLPPERQSELRAALADQPGVQVQLTAPRAPLKNTLMTQATVPPPLSNGSPIHIDVESGGDDQRLLRFFGSSEREQDYTNEALATSTVILSHLYALRNLQGQFPLDKDLSLRSDDRAQLHTLVQDHATAISTSLDALGRQLTPLEANFSVAPCTSSVAPVTVSWQGGSLEALETARVVDHLLRALLTTSQAPAVPDSALPEIDQNLCRLRAELKNLSVPSH